MSGPLTLGTTLIRPDADGDPEEYDVLISFEVDSYTPGYPARIYGDPGDCYPGEAADYEFAFLGAAFDPPDAEAAPLTEAEIVTLKAWFAANHDRACDEAESNEPHQWDYDEDRYERDRTSA
jgi:hypothetical protein